MRGQPTLWLLRASLLALVVLVPGALLALGTAEGRPLRSNWVLQEKDQGKKDSRKEEEDDRKKGKDKSKDKDTVKPKDKRVEEEDDPMKDKDKGKVIRSDNPDPGLSRPNT